MSSAPAWIDITAREAERSRTFYGELLGWEIDVEESVNYGLVQPSDERLPGGIGQASADSPHPPGVVVYFTVDDLGRALERAERLGAARLVAPWELPGLGRMAVIGDPDGNRIGLWQTRSRPAGPGQETRPAGPLDAAHAVTKLPARDLDRARRFYRDRLGLEPVEERDGGLRYMCATTEFHLFLSSGAPSGTSTQLGFEVTNIDDAVAELRSRGLEFEPFDIAGFEVHDDIVVVPNNYPSKGTGERGAFFRDSEGNLLSIGQATN